MSRNIDTGPSSVFMTKKLKDLYYLFMIIFLYYFHEMKTRTSIKRV